MSLPRSGRVLRSAAVISLCALFALLAMGLTLLASGVYRSTARSADENFSHRTALSYLINQVRRSDEVGAISIDQFGDGDALLLTERLDEYEYVTVLYCYKGSLMELYMEKGTGLTPADGVAIMDVESLSIQEENGRLTFSVLAGREVPFVGTVTPRTGIVRGGSL